MGGHLRADALESNRTRGCLRILSLRFRLNPGARTPLAACYARAGHRAGHGRPDARVRLTRDAVHLRQWLDETTRTSYRGTMAYVRSRAGKWYVTYQDAAGRWIEKRTLARSKTEAKEILAELARTADRV